MDWTKETMSSILQRNSASTVTLHVNAMPFRYSATRCSSETVFKSNSRRAMLLSASLSFYAPIPPPSLRQCEVSTLTPRSWTRSPSHPPRDNESACLDEWNLRDCCVSAEGLYQSPRFGPLRDHNGGWAHAPTSLLPPELHRSIDDSDSDGGSAPWVSAAATHL